MYFLFCKTIVPECKSGGKDSYDTEICAAGFQDYCSASQLVKAGYNSYKDAHVGGARRPRDQRHRDERRHAGEERVVRVIHVLAVQQPGVQSECRVEAVVRASTVHQNA